MKNLWRYGVVVIGSLVLLAATGCYSASDDIDIWITADPHVNARHLALSEIDPPDPYHINIDAGDLIADQTPPGTDLGRIYKSERAAHDGAKRYEIAGNHDANYYGKASWFERWVDPLNQPYRVICCQRKTAGMMCIIRATCATSLGGGGT
jgi:hypothetical protein